MVPLQTRLGGNFLLLPVWMESGTPGLDSRHRPSESQSLNLLNGTPLEGSLICAVKRVLDCTESLMWGSDSQGGDAWSAAEPRRGVSPRRSVPWGTHKEGQGQGAAREGELRG